MIKTVSVSYTHLDVYKRQWVPFAGVHAGSLCGYDANEILHDADKLVEALMSVNTYYHPDGQPVIFDLQLEAEALGCELYWDEGGKVPPTVRTHRCV